VGKALIVVIGIALFVYAMFDLIATPADRARYLPKPLWFLVLFIAPIGPLLWLFVGRVGPSTPPSRGKAKPTSPPGPRGPDDDPDYLRNL